MIAVLLVTSSAVSWSALWVTVAVLAMGIGPLIGWRSVKVPPSAKRILVAVILAGALSATAHAVICASCQGCDPFWMEWFYICWPSN